MDTMNYDYTGNTTGVCPYCDHDNSRTAMLLPGSAKCEHFETERFTKGAHYYGFRRELTLAEKLEMEEFEKMLGI
jgi:hypothetical protein